MVWGDYACFTRPEFKTERESYPSSASAAAAFPELDLLEKPQMRYASWKSTSVIRFADSLSSETSLKTAKIPIILKVSLWTIKTARCGSHGIL